MVIHLTYGMTVHCIRYSELLSGFVWRAKADLPGSGSLCAHLQQDVCHNLNTRILLHHDQAVTC